MSPSDLDRYQRDGFLELGPRLGPDDVAAVLARFAELDAAPDVPPQYEAQYDTAGPERRLRKLRRLVWNDPALFAPMLVRAGAPELVEEVVGPGAVIVFHAAFLKPARIGTQVGLHQDQALWSRDYPSAFSVWFALTDVHPDNGGLYGCPGSHSAGSLPHAEDGEHPWHDTLTHRAADLQPAHQFRLSPGDAVMWDRNLAHGSGPNASDSDRSGMVVVFADGSVEGFDPVDAMGLDELRERGAA